mmetsp:Transcript_8684/g.20940  ORF Transcript_8684/g.20940 Transcript_8684/m.20940 type:complete len:444 (+) Transcript_8684:54-1385(+)
MSTEPPAKTARTAPSGTATFERGALRCEVTVVDLGPKMPIATGICFLNHMLDQLVSHGQLGIGVQVSVDDVACLPESDYALQATGGRIADPSAQNMPRPHDQAIFEIVGEAVGTALRGATAGVRSGLAPSRFCAPLDESITVATVGLGDSHFSFSLAPYGAIPPEGREWIGLYRTVFTCNFWQALQRALGARVELTKVRGANAHHVVEATFKSFARALRANIDAAQEILIGELGAGVVAGEKVRGGARIRSTKETTIEVDLKLDGSGVSQISTGVAMLDRLLGEISAASGMWLRVKCDGDLHIDDHHTAEDVAIAIGQSLHDALGDKAGCNRMGSASATEGGALVEVVMDLSNRPHYESDLALNEEWADGMSCEMIEHVFDSLATNSRSTVHVVCRARRQGSGASSELAIATARAFGLALRQCAAIDPRRAGLTASSKGTLSV